MNRFKRVLDKLPTMGVGFGFNFDLPLTAQEVSRLRQGDLGGFDYIEIQTPHVLLFHDIWQIIEAAPTIVHCSQFSLGSAQPRKDERFTQLTKEVMVRASTPWFAEHISLSQFPGGDTKHFFLPFLDGSVGDNVVRNGENLQKLMGFPMLLENAPRLFDVTCALIDEGTFLSDVVNECHCGYLLDLSSARKTCASLGYDLGEYVAKMPLEVLVELHVGDIDVEKVLAIDLIRSCPVRAVTLEANLSQANDKDLRLFVETVNQELNKKGRRSHVSVPSNSPVDDARADGSGPGVDLSAPVKFKCGTSISLYSDHIAIHSPGTAISLLPPAAAKVVSGILLGNPLESMLDISDVDIGMSLATLSLHAQQADDGDPTGWRNWGLAEAYHRSVRSSAATKFEGKEAFEARLSSPENQALRPAFAKEYPLHPFFKLPQPGQLGNDSLSGMLLKRRTDREYLQDQIQLDIISNILYYSCGWTASGIQRVGGMPIIRKTSPSPGSMASIEAYLVALHVTDLVAGIYHYSLVSHGLELLDGENPCEWLVEACGDQSWVSNCSAAILLCGVADRLEWKYPMPKGYQAMLMEAGHVSQAALLCCTAEGLGCFCTAALREGMFEERIRLDPIEETPLLLIGMGQRMV